MDTIIEVDILVNGIQVERAIEWIDKSGWGPGEWQAERWDKVQWTDAASGLACLAVREPEIGHWCGYVGVPEGHPAHGLGKAEAEGLGISAHGGLTFAGPCQEGTEAELTGVCHTPRPGQPERVHWLGFDMAHVRDLKPALAALLARLWDDVPSARLARRRPSDFEVYRTLGYVQAECHELADQLARLGGR